MEAETQPVIFFSLDGLVIGLFVGPSTLEDWDLPDLIHFQPVLSGKIEYEPNSEGLHTAALDDGVFFAYSDRARLNITVFEKDHLTYIVDKLLHDRILGRERLADREYVWSGIRTNAVSILEEMGVIGDPTPEFVDFARTAIESGRREIAIVLIATAVEQKLNVFYRHALTAKNLISNLLTEEEICDIIKSNLPSKTGWLLALLSGSRLPDEIRKQLTSVSELRNQIVHFKAVPSEHFLDELKGSHNLLRQRLDAIDCDRLLQLPIKLSRELDEMLEQIRATNLPDYSIAKDTVSALVESIKKGEMTFGTFPVPLV